MASNKTAEQIATEIISAMKIISQSSLNDISFDKTEICTVIGKQNEAENSNAYIVDNGSLKYVAYVPQPANGEKIAKYKNGDSVRVSILNGNYKDTKIIEGLYVIDEENNPTVFVSPLETMLDITSNIIPDNELSAQYGLKANGNKKEICIWAADFDSDSKYRDIQNSDICDTVAIKGDFKTAFSDINIISGHYGLRLDLYFHTSDNIQDNLANVNKYSVYLDSSDMFGNPYSFLISSTQALKFNISDFGILKSAILYFYQKSDFYYLSNENKKEKFIFNEAITLYDHLIVKNIYISFGSNIVEMDDNVFKIYSNDSRQYNQDNSNSKESMDDYKEFGVLWFNKDDNNKYVGFSDGIATFNPPILEPGKEGYSLKYYDELEYNNINNSDNRLLAQQGKKVPSDKNGLLLSANIEEEQTLFNQVYNLLNKDVWQDLLAFESSLNELMTIQDVKNVFKTIMYGEDSSNRGLKKFIVDLENNQKTFVDNYINILAYGKEYQNATVLNEAKPNVPENISSIEDKYLKVREMITDKQILTWINKINPTVINTNDNYTNLFEVLIPYINGDYKHYKSIYDSFVSRFSSLSTKIISLCNQINSIIDQNDVFRLKAYLNNNYIFTEYNSPIDSTLYDNRYCIYWYRYRPEEESDEYTLAGKGWKRITQNEKIGSKTDLENLGVPKQSLVGEDGISYHFARDTNEILGLNLDTNRKTEKIKALLFYNHTKYESNEIEFTNENPPMDEAAADQNGALYLEHGDNSRSSYQLYGVNNCLVNASDGYKTRYLQVCYDGELGGNECLSEAQVFWYIPKQSTMLGYDIEDYSSDFTIYDDNKVNDENLVGYVCFYRTITTDNNSRLFPYRIRDYYSPTFSQNEIICKVKTKNSTGKTLEAIMPFTFSSFGTSGTDYTLVVQPVTTIGHIINGQDLELQFKIYDHNNREVEDDFKAECSWCNYNYYVCYPYSNGKGAIIKNSKSWGGAGILKVTVPFSIKNNQKNNESEIDRSRTVNLTTYYPIAWSKDNYYIEGASTIVYNSEGVQPSYYKDAYKIFYNSGDQKDTEIPNVKWEIQYYFYEPYSENNGGYIRYSELPANHADLSKFALILNYMPSLNDKQKISPSVMYLDSYSNTYNLYPVVICRDQYDNALWTQPILLMQNQYASTMLNEWDGSFKIDDANGTIMSTMLGAGRKNNNNQFEGVLIGDIQGVQGGDVSCNGIGIYGYNEGKQSFRFGVDGKAFLGKSGCGRIIFDGNSGTIQSAAYSSTSTTGLRIDLTNNTIDAKGNFKLTAGSINTSSYLGLASGDGNHKLSATINDFWSDDWRIIAGTKFGVTGAGDVYASNVKLTGVINAAANSVIGGWTIGQYKIYAGDATTGVAVMQCPGNGANWVFAAGDNGTDAHSAYGKCPFRVSVNGELFATKGKIGGWEIDGEKGFNLIDNSNKTWAFLYPTGKGTVWTAAANGLVNLAFGLGTTASINFGVTPTGKLYASDAVINGTITATNSSFSGTVTADYITANTGGYIGGWQITSTQLKSGNIILDSSNGSILSSSGNNSFKISNDGTVSANAGTIGGWEITQDTLQKQSGDLITGFQHPGSGNIAITVGADNNNDWTSGNFYVTHEGIVHAKKAKIQGTIEADGGKFGVWRIIEDSMGEWITTTAIQLEENEQVSLHQGISLGIMTHVDGALKDFPVINITSGNFNMYGKNASLNVSNGACLRVDGGATISFSNAKIEYNNNGVQFKPYSYDYAIRILTSDGRELDDGNPFFIKEGLICQMV